MCPLKNNKYIHMKLNSLLLFLAVTVLFAGCKNEKHTTGDTNLKTNSPALKNISELSYLEIYHALFVDDNGGFDAHGDLYGQDAVSSLIINSENNDCGNALFLLNNSDKPIVLAVKASFSLTGNPVNEMTRAYTIKPTDTLSLGHSVLCYDGKEYPIKRDIISAGFSANSQ
ncbi:hypothetical protein A9Q87_08895 [Flavobacteriales bacterium 34_180_T64]|nr:hypothetical protein A9Q87_08895 [Flavobacteriales bacterium 34_180_T64]